MELRWLPEAVFDLERVYLFLATKDPQAASDAWSKILAKAESLRLAPMSGIALHDEMGRRESYLRYGKGCYVMRYVVVDDCLVILRVWHSRQSRS